MFLGTKILMEGVAENTWFTGGLHISNHFQMGFIHNLCNREDMDVEDWAERATSRKKAEGGAGFSSKMRKFAEK